MKQLAFRLVVALLAGVLCGAASGAAAQENADALVAGELVAVPTIRSIGLYWNVRGDANGNATANVTYRKTGDSQWKQAMPLWRMVPQKVDVERNTIGGISAVFGGETLRRWPRRMREYLVKCYGRNYLAGSILTVEPATRYEIKTILVDPDGGGATKNITVTTRDVPAIPKGDRRIDVTGGGDALRDAVAGAEPGDVFFVHAGTYNGPVVVTASGTAEKPISITAAGDGEVVLHGPTAESKKKAGEGTAINLKASHIRINGLTIRSFYMGIVIGHDGPVSDEVFHAGAKGPVTDVAVTNCRISGVWTAVTGFADEAYVADNVLEGVYTGGMEGTGIEIKGVGNVYCYNAITRFSDGMSPGSPDCDIYGNDVIRCGTDGLELDHGGPNCRVWGNRFSFTGCNGISFQPYIGGPAYVFRNLDFNISENTIKDRYKSSGLVLVNNTMVAGWCTDLIEHTFARNNLFITRGKRLALQYRIEDFLGNHPAISPLDLDYDGYNGAIQGKEYNRTTGQRRTYWSASEVPLVRRHSPKTLAAFQRMTGQERHGILLTAKECFAVPFAPQYPDNWRRIDFDNPPPDLRLKEGSPAIDAGTVLPNIAEEYNSKAPDLGALEFGAPLPHWGPREGD